MDQSAKSVFVLGAGFTKAFLPDAPLLVDDYNGDLLLQKFEHFKHAHSILKLCMKRLSQGRFNWWPKTPDARVPLSARELVILMWNGNPEQAQMAQDWRRVA